MKRNNDNWALAGYFCVDAGICWIGDPCYWITPDTEHHPAKDWGEFCEKTIDKDVAVFDFDGKVVSQKKAEKGEGGLGVMVHTGYGDGQYPVWVRRNKEGRIMEMRVSFEMFGDEEEENE